MSNRSFASKSISSMIHFTKVDLPSPFLPLKAIFSPLIDSQVYIMENDMARHTLCAHLRKSQDSFLRLAGGKF